MRPLYDGTLTRPSAAQIPAIAGPGGDTTTNSRAVVDDFKFFVSAGLEVAYFSSLANGCVYCDSMSPCLLQQLSNGTTSGERAVAVAGCSSL